MNKTLITLAIIGLIAIMFLGVILIAAWKPDSLGTIIPFVGTTLGTTISMVVLFYSLGKTNAKVEKIEHNTNGINTALLAQVTGHSEDTIDRIKKG